MILSTSISEKAKPNDSVRIRMMVTIDRDEGRGW